MASAEFSFTFSAGHGLNEHRRYEGAVLDGSGDCVISSCAETCLSQRFCTFFSRLSRARNKHFETRCRLDPSMETLGARARACAARMWLQS